MVKLIKPTEIPEAKTIRKESKVPALINQIPKGQTAVIDSTDPEYKVQTVRAYIEKQHKKQKLLDYKIEQRSKTDTTNPTQPTK